MRKVCPTGYTMMKGVCKEIPISTRPMNRAEPGCCSQGPGEVSYECQGGVMISWTWMCTDGATYDFNNTYWLNIEPCYHGGSVRCTCNADCGVGPGKNIGGPNAAPPRIWYGGNNVGISSNTKSSYRRGGGIRRRRRK